jgi:hypothetical protein
MLKERERGSVAASRPQKTKKRRILWKYGKGFAFTTFPQYGDGGVVNGDRYEK